MVLVARRCLIAAGSGDEKRVVELADAVADVAPDACGTLVCELAVALDLVVEKVTVVVVVVAALGANRGCSIEVVPVHKQSFAVYLGRRLRTRSACDTAVIRCDGVCAVEIIPRVVLDVALEVDRGRGVLHEGCTRCLRHADLAEVVARRIDEVTVRRRAVRIR